MPETNFRVLCEQLMELAEGKRYDGSAVIAKARAALARSEPVTPTNEELKQLLFNNHRSAIEFACDTKAEGNIVIDNHIAFARAVLARWGTPANNTGGTHFDDT